MKKLIVLLAALAFVAVNPVANAGIINIDDGLSHTINYYIGDTLILDDIVANDPGTHVNLVDGGVIEGLNTCVNSTATMTGGSVSGQIVTVDNSTVTISGGSVSGQIWTVDNSTVTISGGLVVGELIAVFGGNIYLDGTGFQVNDLRGHTIGLLSNGDKLSDLITTPWSDYGTITGTLADGSALNIDFHTAGTGDIIIMPEPYTLALLGLGVFALRKRKA